MTVVASARNLSVDAARGRTWTRLVDPIDLDVHAGEVLGIVGESGAGKTLTTRAMVGLLPRGTRAAGEVTLAGRTFDASAIPRAELGRTASVVLQNPLTGLNPLDRVGRQLTEGVVHLRLMSRAAAVQRATELLARLGLTDATRILRLYPHQLSGGMAQRVAIAAALMPRPRLVIVDEPTTALDANVRIEVLRLIGELGREADSGVVMVSHDLALVSRFCQRVAIMYAGRIVEQAAASGLLATALHPYTRALLSCTVSPQARSRASVPVITGAPPDPQDWPAGCVYAPRCPHAWDECTARRPAPVAADDRDAACHLARLPNRAGARAVTAYPAGRRGLPDA
jgi:oligopeptide/dipeptide ABC transporter ATP-binding protein